ncbi:hypothetical protein EGI32_15930 [Ferruginibacter sp. HRS2-29]|nr:hypothetical protein [Ferruginibacter sp. HRS2-29]
MTDGRYTVSKEAMKPHVYTGNGYKSIFYKTVNAEEVVLRAARFADKYKMWVADGSGGFKAKVQANVNVGTLGNGRTTNTINVYRNSNNILHGSPGTPR